MSNLENDRCLSEVAIFAITNPNMFSHAVGRGRVDPLLIVIILSRFTDSWNLQRYIYGYNVYRRWSMLNVYVECLC